ncbi:hypothetical protein [Alicyclobacillus sp. SO9]|uniref:hypothetical protein n=1 Tax=Alicyclobacillus sp. SO9 TaxID=2665646 RepID=UPI0018E7C4F0|nr:hypothetical protein [Alicyclobacillus sp. SO9]QQE81598.1 hypothetical protein GI364_24710 [Alicyclobacillus sp. SO9]
MKDLWMLAGTEKYKDCEPGMWCNVCNEQRDREDTFCFECGHELEKVLVGPMIDAPGQYRERHLHLVK